jgi:hypothetical protein
MKKAKITLTLLFLLVFGACSIIEVEDELPPDFLLEKAQPLPKPNVETTGDIISRLITAEAEYSILSERFNILIDWVSPLPPT